MSSVVVSIKTQLAERALVLQEKLCGPPTQIQMYYSQRTDDGRMVSSPVGGQKTTNYQDPLQTPWALENKRLLFERTLNASGLGGQAITCLTNSQILELSRAFQSMIYPLVRRIEEFCTKFNISKDQGGFIVRKRAFTLTREQLIRLEINQILEYLELLQGIETSLLLHKEMDKDRRVAHKNPFWILKVLKPYKFDKELLLKKEYLDAEVMRGLRAKAAQRISGPMRFI